MATKVKETVIALSGGWKVTVNRKGDIVRPDDGSLHLKAGAFDRLVARAAWQRTAPKGAPDQLACSNEIQCNDDGSICTSGIEVDYATLLKIQRASRAMRRRGK